METPSSARRVTRSQTLASSNGNSIPLSSDYFRKMEDSEKSMSKSRQRSTQKQQDRSALIDITNDSPIVGLANGGSLETPLGGKQRGSSSRVKKTPGSGEALLRGQVKTLLQKVEEEAVLSKLSLESRPFLQLVTSPMGLLAPTPANTPQIPNLSGSFDTGLVSVTPSPIVQEQLISQVVNHVFEGKNEENSESEKSLITRSLLLDFSEKSEISEECCSELSEVMQGSVDSSCNTQKTISEDDDASVWSIQVNASTRDEEDEEEEVAEEEEEEDYYEDVEEEGGYDVDELCEGLNKISMNEGSTYAGKHIRFVYNSDDELIKEEEEGGNSSSSSSSSSSPNVMHLKGLPTPKGKHLRFSEEEEGK
ncbi:uncharacterized protein [Arachis hypogaea]|uniref:uncharacterized protein isoform X1 n=1 Tax=Arachis hypogaea TaxID=3818 RepID=UPI000DECD25E|nr:glutamic acid-rich protein isoform X1 [Arachis hypogaea]